MRIWRRSRRDAMATCREVGKVLQSYLDGQVDELTARRVSEHLDACRRCGLDARVFDELKQSLARGATHMDPSMVERVTAFGRTLSETPPDAAIDPPTA